MIKIFIVYVLLEVTKASVRQARFGREGNEADHGYEMMTKQRSFDNFANGDHESASAWSDIDKKADSSYGHAKSWGQEARKSGAHRQAAGSNSNFDSNDYGRGVRTKTYGFFDYQYIKPQFHIEQFHVDEKHSNKHASDSHSTRALHSSNNDFHDRGVNSYAKSHGLEGSEKSKFGRGSHEGVFKESRYSKDYGGDVKRHFNHGNHKRGVDYGSEFTADRHNHGHYPDYGKRSAYPRPYHRGAFS